MGLFLVSEVPLYIRGMILYEREVNQNLYGKDFFYTACSLLGIFKSSCNKLHCQNGFNRILFSYKIGSELSGTLKWVRLPRERARGDFRERGPLSLLIVLVSTKEQLTNCVGIDFCKMTLKTLCMR